MTMWLCSHTMREYLSSSVRMRLESGPFVAISSSCSGSQTLSIR